MLDNPTEEPLGSDDVDGSCSAEKTAATPLAFGIDAGTSEVETAPDDANDDDDDYTKLLSHQERKDDAYIDEIIEATANGIAEDHELGEVVQGEYSEDKLKQLRSLYVVDKGGKSVHKRTLLANINKGISLSKSTDRTNT